MTVDEQLQLWVDGISVHNAKRDECCPDFSCCKPALQQPKEVRSAFLAASESCRHNFLMMFLEEAINAATSKKVYLSDGKTHEAD